MKFYFLFLLSGLFFLQCTFLKNTNEDVNCDRIASKIDQLYIDYYGVDLGENYNRIDSALCLIDSVLFRCEKYNLKMISNKMIFLSMKNNFSEAIDFIQSLDEDIMYPLNKSVLLKRFKAMQAQSEGDMKTRNKLITKIVTELTDSISKHHIEIDSVFCLPNSLEIMQNKNILIILQYYYYKSQIVGADKVSNELDSMQERLNGNKEFFNDILNPILKRDFMSYDGI